LKNELLEILGRLDPCPPFAGESGNLFCPDGKDIEYDVILVKGKSSISGIEDSEQPL
jgi:hypothetical protein